MYIQGTTWDCADTLCWSSLTFFLVLSSSYNVSNGLPTAINPSQFIEISLSDVYMDFYYYKCFSISFVVYHRTKSLSFEKFTNICVFGEIIPFLSHLCHLFALHAISAVFKLLTLSYKLSASLQDLFYPLYLEPISRSLLYCHKIVLAGDVSLFLLY